MTHIEFRIRCLYLSCNTVFVELSPSPVCLAATPGSLEVRGGCHVSVFRFRLPSFVKSDEVVYFAVLYTAVVVARVSHASRLVFMRTLVCALSGVFSCDRLNRRFSCEQIFERKVRRP